MSRTGGEATRQRILDTAEELFCERGFDATSVDRIARAAQVNKALIYYHFKDKNDLIVSLFATIVEALGEHLEAALGEAPPPGGRAELREKVREEIRFMMKRRRIISLMLMESLKDRDKAPFLFECAQIVMAHERGEAGLGPRAAGPLSREAQRHDLHEFFTGFLPMMLFAALGDKWCTYVGCDSENVLDDFIDVFERSHLASHLPHGDEVEGGS